MKNILLSSFAKLGGTKILRIKNNVPRVLFWHGVDYVEDQIIEAECTPVENFKKQLKYIKKHYEIVSLDEIYRRYYNQSFTGKEIALTFDDGYKNNLTVLAPILKEDSIPFAVFISINNITEGNIFPTSLVRLIVWGSTANKLILPSIEKEIDISTKQTKKIAARKLSEEIKKRPLNIVTSIYNDLKSNISEDEFSSLLEKYSSVLPMSWEDVDKIRDYGATIGSHCLDHICCHDNQSLEEVKKQIFESKAVIEAKLKTSCVFFVYPNGSFTKMSNEYVINAGYKLGFSTKPMKIRYDGCPAIIPRICVPASVDLAKIKINFYPR